MKVSIWVSIIILILQTTKITSYGALSSNNLCQHLIECSYNSQTKKLDPLKVKMELVNWSWLCRLIYEAYFVGLGFANFDNFPFIFPWWLTFVKLVFRVLWCQFQQSLAFLCSMCCTSMVRPHGTPIVQYQNFPDFGNKTSSLPMRMYLSLFLFSICNKSFVKYTLHMIWIGDMYEWIL